MKERFRVPSYLLALSLIANACSPAPAEAEKKTTDHSQSSDFPKGFWRYTSGPHDDPGKDEVRYAIDIAPDKVIACPIPGGRSSYLVFGAIKGGATFYCKGIWNSKN